jgi:hypothetical protein
VSSPKENKMYRPTIISCDHCRADFDDRLIQKVKREDEPDLLLCPDCLEEVEEGVPLEMVTRPPRG